MLSKLFPTFSTHISSGDTLIIGVSGGPDSTALLTLLAEFSKTTPCRIIVAHVNHGIRRGAARRDEEFVKKMAKMHGLTFNVKRAHLLHSQKTALEERGREVRRTFFESLAKKYQARWIITAHTADDNLETIIFNFTRGSGLRGLAGMKSTAGLYFKPLLNIEKKELLSYLHAREIPFCVDATNADTQFSRNLIRKKMLPLMRRLNPNIRQTLFNNRQIFIELDELLTAQAHNFIGAARAAGPLSFSLKEFQKLPSALQSAVIQESYLRAISCQQLPAAISHSSSPRLSSSKVGEVRRLLLRNVGKKKIECAGKISFSLDKGLVRVD